MNKAEIEVALQVALRQCELAGYPLNPAQQQLLLSVLEERLCPSTSRSETNPLDRLTPEQRQALFQFIKTQEQQNQSWKANLLNDWLQSRNSGAVQFIRDLYGVQWLETVTPAHLADYEEEALRLKVGDRIEISNGLWEWVQETGPCSREWFPCVVIGITETINHLSKDFLAANQTSINCTVRFENGSEYEIQGIYEWNRPNWRWAKGDRKSRG
jgi:hypothetical protein